MRNRFASEGYLLPDPNDRHPRHTYTGNQTPSFTDKAVTLRKELATDWTIMELDPSSLMWNDPGNRLRPPG